VEVVVNVPVHGTVVVVIIPGAVEGPELGGEELGAEEPPLGAEEPPLGVSIITVVAGPVSPLLV